MFLHSRRPSISDRFVPSTALALILVSTCACGRSENAVTTMVASPQPTPDQVIKPQSVLRVCADPNNLPFSNQRQEGFENRVAEILAKDMGARLEYTWWPQRRGFVRNTLRARRCDVMPGVAFGYELVLTTKPYYR